jgi:hypothetical protein
MVLPFGKDQAGAGGEQAREIAQLRGYILNNAGGLKDYRLRVEGGSFLRGMGIIESNIDKLVAGRMKKRGMSWTKRGGDRMVRLINLREQGELYHWVKPKPRKPDGKPALRFRLRPDTDGPSEDKYHTWLEANLPALSGPQSDRPLGLDTPYHDPKYPQKMMGTSLGFYRQEVDSYPLAQLLEPTTKVRYNQE